MLRAQTWTPTGGHHVGDAATGVGAGTEAAARSGREEQAAELNEQLTEYVDALNGLLNYTLRYPVNVDFQAMKVAVRRFQPDNLAHSIPEPRADDFKPKQLGGLATLVPGAEKRFRAKWEQGRAAFEQAHARWQREEQQRREQLARAEAEHKRARESAQEQHRRIDELEADFHTGKRAAIEQCLATALQASCYPSGFPHEFTLIYRSREHELLIGYEFPLARDIILEQASYRYVKTKGVIESKARTATDTQKLYKSMLAQLTLRTLYELFTADQYQHVQRIAFTEW
jgi:restriction system protein